MANFINRVWAMPNKETFKIKPIKELLDRYVPDGGEGWIDFFARKQRRAEFTNDINPEYKTTWNKDALTLAQTLKDGSYNGVLFDSPFSMNQNKTLYSDFGRGHFCVRPDSMVYWSQFKTEVSRITRPGGIVITCAWNSMGIGKKRGFEMLEILLVPHGGSRNDTIITVEKKIAQ